MEEEWSEGSRLNPPLKPATVKQKWLKKEQLYCLVLRNGVNLA